MDGSDDNICPAKSDNGPPSGSPTVQQADSTRTSKYPRWFRRLACWIPRVLLISAGALLVGSCFSREVVPLGADSFLVITPGRATIISGGVENAVRYFYRTRVTPQEAYNMGYVHGGRRFVHTPGNVRGREVRELSSEVIDELILEGRLYIESFGSYYSEHQPTHEEFIEFTRTCGRVGGGLWILGVRYGYRLFPGKRVHFLELSFEEFVLLAVVLCLLQRILAILLSWRRGRLIQLGLCPVCRYNITGASHKVCPECGSAVPDDVKTKVKPDASKRPESPAP